MRKAALFVVLGLAFGFAAIMLLPDGRDSAAPLVDGSAVHARVGRAGRPAEPLASVSLPATPAPGTDDPSAAAAEEVFDELDALLDLVPAIDDPDPEPPSPDAAAQRRIERLITAGFEPARATAIVDEEMDLHRAAVTAELETTGTVRALSMGRSPAPTDALRHALGDADYERYLVANGKPTHVRIMGITPDSLAAHAGLEAGDRIVAYAGRRVFNLRDLNELTLAGTHGETVATTVIRDGQPLQLYVARGPLGLTVSESGALDE